MNISEFTTLARFSSDGALNNNYHSVLPTKLNESWAGRRLIEALNQLPPSKFGSSTDMRFQQKQLQEREQRKLEMTASKPNISETDSELISSITSNSTTTKSLNSTIGNGKVRQMFNERRRGAGIDRSNPLKPITSRSSPSSSSSLSTTSMTIKNADQTFIKRQEATALRPINGRKVEKSTPHKLISRKNNNGNDSVDCANDENMRLSNRLQTYRADDFDLDNETFPEQHLDNHDHIETLATKTEGILFGNSTVEYDDKNNNPADEKKVNLSARIKLNPVLTKKSPPAMNARLQENSNRPTQNLVVQAESTVNTTQKASSSKPKIVVKTSPKMAKPLANSHNATNRQKTEAPSNPSNPPPGTVPCKICSRFFNEDRVLKHEAVCEKTSMKQRKIFDASKHRVKGTEAEKYLKKPARGKASTKTATITSNSKLSNDTPKKSNWRKKHEEFIAAIRAAKEVQAHLAKGGKLSDLPPPPPSENPDYITCPHCSRRFNEAAANRHIPKCANMLHNKPKPANKKR